MRQKVVNEKLVAARLERHWTQEQACEHLAAPSAAPLRPTDTSQPDYAHAVADMG